MAKKIFDPVEQGFYGSAVHAPDITGHPFRTHFSGPLYGVEHERNRGLPSVTVPDEAMTVEEILKRYAAGLSMPDARVPMYDESEGVLDESRPLNWDQMDFAEKIQFMEEHQAKIELLKREIEGKEKLRKDKEREDQIDKLAEEKAAKKLAAAAKKKGDTPAAGPEGQ